MDLNNLFQSKIFRRAVIAVGLLAIIFLSFSAGAFVGYRKARFSYEWGENYDRNFGGPHRGILGLSSEPGFMNAHGTFGSILGVNAVSSTIAIEGQDKMEKIVSVLSSTALRENHAEIGFADLESGETVVVLGAPNGQGQIEARLVRVLQ